MLSAWYNKHNNVIIVTYIYNILWSNVCLPEYLKACVTDACDESNPTDVMWMHAIFYFLHCNYMKKSASITYFQMPQQSEYVNKVLLFINAKRRSPQRQKSVRPSGLIPWLVCATDQSRAFIFTTVPSFHSNKNELAFVIKFQGIINLNFEFTFII